MAIILPDNHIFLSAENEMQTICKPLFETTDIAFFDWIRIFDDGFCYFLASDSKVVRYFFETEYSLYTPVPPALIKQKFHYLIPTDGPYQKPMHDMHSFFNLAYPLDFFERQEGYVDLFCFAGHKNNDDMINFYLNHIDVLENFILHFKEKIIGLYKPLEPQKFLLPEHMHTNFNSKNIIGEYEARGKLLEPNISNKIKNHWLMVNNRRVSLTGREADCLNKLTLGYSAKEIAKLLALSPRTVEDYIQNAKGKMGYSKKSDIVRIMRSQDNSK